MKYAYAYEVFASQIFKRRILLHILPPQNTSFNKPKAQKEELITVKKHPIIRVLLLLCILREIISRKKPMSTKSCEIDY